MAPSEKTELRRLQRAAQRQRVRQAQEEKAQMLDHAGVPEGLTTPTNGVALEAQSADTKSAPRLTAETFADAICNLVDMYRAGNVCENLERSTCEILASGREGRASLNGGRCNGESDSKALQLPGLVTSACAPIALPSSAIDATTCQSGLPASPKSCPYTVRNTFIDFVLSPREDVAPCDAVFSTWPGAKQCCIEDAQASDNRNGSHCATLVEPRLGGNEQPQSLEEGEIIEDEDQCAECDDDELSTSNLEGCWQPIPAHEASPQVVKTFQTSRTRPRDVTLSEKVVPAEPQRGEVETHVDELKGLLTQSLESQGGPWKMCRLGNEELSGCSSSSHSSRLCTQEIDILSKARER